MNSFQRFRRAKCNGVIDFEAKGTWPQRVHEILSSALNELRGYEFRQLRVDALCRRDVMSRYNPPPNEFQYGIDDIHAVAVANGHADIAAIRCGGALVGLAGHGNGIEDFAGDGVDYFEVLF